MLIKKIFTAEERAQIISAINQIEEYCKCEISPSMRPGELLQVTISEISMIFNIRCPFEVEINWGKKTAGFKEIIIDRYFKHDPITTDLEMCKELILSWAEIKPQLHAVLDQRAREMVKIRNFQI